MKLFDIKIFSVGQILIDESSNSIFDRYSFLFSPTLGFSKKELVEKALVKWEDEQDIERVERSEWALPILLTISHFQLFKEKH
ncbi:hypothetical protein HZS_7402 [Henneguya salminicola]|nr:hypothetical protein HZS_7402 [Henneguya salminicola]